VEDFLVIDFFKYFFYISYRYFFSNEFQPFAEALKLLQGFAVAPLDSKWAGSAPIYSWLIEGFQTRDLQEGEVFLVELS